MEKEFNIQQLRSASQLLLIDTKNNKGRSYKTPLNPILPNVSFKLDNEEEEFADLQEKIPNNESIEEKDDGTIGLSNTTINNSSNKPSLLYSLNGASLGNKFLNYLFRGN